MKKLLILVFLALFCTSLSGVYIFDAKIVISKHGTSRDSLAYFIIEKSDGSTADTFGIVDTLGNITWIGNIWNDGNIILDGDTIVIRDATKGDSIRLYHDSSSFVIIGDAGTDNLELEGIDLELKNGALIQNPHVDTITITEAVTKCSGKIVGNKVESRFFFQELITSKNYVFAISGASTYSLGGFTTFSSDSFTLDSLRVMWYTNQNDVYIDSIALMRGITRTTEDPILLMGDGANYGAGTTTHIPITYTVDATISFDWRLRINFWVATSGVAGTGYCMGAKAYCHY